MAIKLGEMLLKEKIITPSQLDDALKSQVIFGIKLGSSLIELGFIDAEDLSHFLSLKLGVPCVKKQELMSIPADVLKKIPVTLAEKYRVIPIGYENRRLPVAMADPTDFRAIDELAFVTGLIVEPHIAPELLITFALERHYGVKRDMRYLRVSGQPHGRARVGTEQQNASAHANPNEAGLPPVDPLKGEKDSAAANRDEDLYRLEFSKEFEGFGSLPDLPEAEPAIKNYSIDQLSMDFAHAGSRDDVADVFIKYLGQEFSSGAIMIVRGKAVVGWRAVQARQNVTDFDKLAIALEDSAAISRVIATSIFHIGPLINSPADLQLTEALKCDPWSSLLIIPVVMHNKVVAVVIVTGETEALGQRQLEFQNLARKASLAFEMLIIKNKILMT